MPTSLRLRPTASRVALLAVVLLVGSAVPAAGGDGLPPPADTSSGKVGPFSVIDSPESPGGTCTYGKTVDEITYNHLDRLRVRAPEVYARSTRTTQRVSWRLVAQAWTGSAWVRYARTTWQSGTARPGRSADLTHKVVDIGFHPEGTFDGWRGKVEIRWYGKDGTTVVGRASAWPDHYRGKESGSTFPMSWQCGWTTG